MYSHVFPYTFLKLVFKLAYYPSVLYSAHIQCASAGVTTWRVGNSQHGHLPLSSENVLLLGTPLQCIHIKMKSQVNETVNDILLLIIIILLLGFSGHQHHPITHPIVQPPISIDLVFQSRPPFSVSTSFFMRWF